MAFEEVYIRQPYFAQFICLFYPIGIGAIKYSQGLLLSKYKVDTIYEFISLGLAALPYKFIFLNIDLPLVIIFIILIKFGYKTFGYFIIFLPCSQKLKQKLRKKNEIVEDQPQMEEDSEEMNKISTSVLPKISNRPQRIKLTPVKKFKNELLQELQNDLSRISEEKAEFEDSFSELNPQADRSHKGIGEDFDVSQYVSSHL